MAPTGDACSQRFPAADPRRGARFERGDRRARLDDLNAAQPADITPTSDANDRSACLVTALLRWLA
jgi:hypothetical protein